MHDWSVSQFYRDASHLDDKGDVIHLRADLRSLFNDNQFVFYPKTADAYVVHVIEDDPDLRTQYHNIHVPGLKEAQAPFLYARFAWAIFGLLESSPFFASQREASHVDLLSGRTTIDPYREGKILGPQPMFRFRTSPDSRIFVRPFRTYT